MPLLLLGLIFAVGLFAFYLISTRADRSDASRDDKTPDPDLRTDENVIFLPDDLEEVKARHRSKK